MSAWRSLTVLAPLSLLAGCPGSSVSPERSTVVVGATTEGTVSLSDGAQLRVPMWAVPSGPVEFTLERTTATPPIPSGEKSTSDAYVVGPGNYTFKKPLQLTLPVRGTVSAELVRVYRLDPTTQKPELYRGEYDPATKTVTVQTYAFSPWGTAEGTVSDASSASGAFKIANTSSNSWLNVCVKSAQLAFPAGANDVTHEPIAIAPGNTTGWASTMNWYLPQGTYDLCIESQTAGTVSTPPGNPVHMDLAGQVIGSPWTYLKPVTTDLSFGTLSSPVTGPCTCSPTATAVAKVFEVGNIAGVQNTPTAPTTFTTEACYFVSQLVTYHWNNGTGHAPGTITLKADSGTTYGPWQATATPGQGGAPSVYWNVYPNLVLPKGKYTVTDSDPTTWSQNSGTGGAGMAWAEGVVAPCP